MSRRRIAVVTGTRAEYGLLRSTMAALRADRRVDLQVIATGMHLLRRSGGTVREILGDGFSIAARVRMQSGDDGGTDQSDGLGRGVRDLARAFARLESEIVLVLGDRIEALAGALAGVTTGRIVAHVHGGDVAAGDFDDSLRHSITKLSHVHFAATRQSARRIVRMGEDPRRVHVVGAPGLDDLAAAIGRAAPRTGLGREALVIQHAYGRGPDHEERVARAVFEAVLAEGLRPTIVHPNTDRGCCGVVRAIEALQAARGGDVRVVRSLSRADFLDALLAARVLVGNSSCGVIEAPFAGTASVNVGDRQAGRQAGGRSIVSVGEGRRQIRAGIRAALRKRPRRGRAGCYGAGRAGAAIARLLVRLPVGEALRRKRITY